MKALLIFGMLGFLTSAFCCVTVVGPDKYVVDQWGSKKKEEAVKRPIKSFTPFEK